MASIALAGAGIVGATIATELVLAGHDVCVFEPDLDGLPTSSGNAALIALPEIAPLASPGILRAVPGWLLDPLGPLAVRWPDLPALMPWLLAFLASATPSHGAKVRQALASLMRTGLADHQSLAERIGYGGHLRQLGYLSVHDTPSSVDAAVTEMRLVEQMLGYGFEPLSAPATRALVPQLEGAFAGAVHQPGYWAVTNPLTVLRRYQSFLRERTRIVPHPVTGLRPTERGIVVRAGGTEQTFDRAVVAAGIWSRELVRGLGLKVLLETERGYNTTFTDLDWNLPMAIGFADHGFIATPLVDGLRVGGAVELAKPATAPNWHRATAMRAKMRRYVPALPEGGTPWMGRRPSTPDSLPVISRHPADPRIVFAFGHGHLGLTLSAVSARHVAGLVAPGPADPALAPFDIARFQ